MDHSLIAGLKLLSSGAGRVQGKDIDLTEAKWRVGKGEAIASNGSAWCKVRGKGILNNFPE